MAKNNLLRMDNVGIVVESLDRAISFFIELGLKLEGILIGLAEELDGGRVPAAKE